MKRTVAKKRYTASDMRAVSDNPEWTKRDFAKAKAFDEVFPTMSKGRKFDVQDYLKTPDQQAAYLKAAFDSNDFVYCCRYRRSGQGSGSFEVLPRDWIEPRSNLQDVSRGRQSNARYTQQGDRRSWLQANSCAERSDRWLGDRAPAPA